MVLYKTRTCLSSLAVGRCAAPGLRRSAPSTSMPRVPRASPMPTTAKALFVVLSLFLAAEPAVAAPAGGDLTIVDARLYPAADAAPIDHGTLVIRGGRIAAIR